MWLCYWSRLRLSGEGRCWRVGGRWQEEDGMVDCDILEGVMREMECV